MNQLSILVAIKIESEMQLFVMMPQIIQNNDFEISILSLNVKTNWLNLHGLNEMEIIEAIGDFLK
jgi:magnesium transporter